MLGHRAFLLNQGKIYLEDQFLKRDEAVTMWEPVFFPSLAEEAEKGLFAAFSFWTESILRSMT
jgi:hypothetical protein